MITIIAILAAMLLPALQKARERAQSIKCVGQMKELSTAWSVYSDSFGGFFLPANSDSPMGSGNHTWDLKMIETNSISLSFDLAALSGGTTAVRAPLNRRRMKLFTCPAAEKIALRKNDFYYYSAVPTPTTYSYHGRFNPLKKVDGNIDPASLYNVRKPNELKKGIAKIAVMIDGGHHEQAATDFGNTSISYYKPWLVNFNYHFLKYAIHGGYSNIIWADGHVAARNNFNGLFFNPHF